MKVKELINILGAMDAELNVCIPWHEAGMQVDVAGVFVDEDGDVVVTDNKEDAKTGGP